MAGLRELLSVGLGLSLGVILIAAPRAALRASVFLGPQRGRRGEYGTDDDIPETWAWIVRSLGVACLVVAVVILSRTNAGAMVTMYSAV